MDELACGELLLDKKKNSALSIVLYILIVVLIALILFFYFIGCAIVDGHSMDDTLYDGQRVMIQKHGYSVERGDIVTFSLSDGGEQKTLIKRAVATGGDKVLFVENENTQYVDMYIMKKGESVFKLVEEPYIKDGKMFHGDKFQGINVLPYIDKDTIENADAQSDHWKQLTEKSIAISEGCFYYLGDNRNNSTDARHYGECALSSVTGKVIAIAQKGSALEGFINFMFSLN